ncbi:MAG: LysM peptidoglycan-binding domain-containing protein [Thermodesulfobacteriota bacterium]
MYKEYFVFPVDKEKYLCTSHTVQENEYIYKILRNRGSNSADKISALKKINSHLNNPDRIEPGETVFIPLKKVNPDEFDINDSGRILVPFITKKSVKDLLAEDSQNYNVQPGDTVSELLSEKMHSDWGTEKYQKAVKLFKYLNPRIDDINKLSKGQMINLPKPDVVNREWYPSLFTPEVEKELTSSALKENNKISIPLKKKEKKTKKKKNILDLISNSLNGKAETTGKLYIPYNDTMLILNLKKTPFIRSENFPRIFFFERNDLNKKDREIIKKFYDKAVFFNLSNKVKNKNQELKTKTVNRLYGLKSEIIYENKIASTSDSSEAFEIFTTDDYYNAPYNFLNYFTKKNNIILPCSNKTKSDKNFTSLDNNNRKLFVKELLEILECKYNENTEISFPYNDVQVKAYTNIAKNPQDKFLIIDFEEFYGDTIDSIKKINMKVSTISSNDSPDKIVSDICSKLGFTVLSNPLFPESAGKSDFNINMKIPGVFVLNPYNKENPYLFFTSIPSFKFPEYVLYYLNWLNIRTIFI